MAKTSATEPTWQAMLSNATIAVPQRSGVRRKTRPG